MTSYLRRQIQEGLRMSTVSFKRKKKMLSRQVTRNTEFLIYFKYHMVLLFSDK